MNALPLLVALGVLDIPINPLRVRRTRHDTVPLLPAAEAERFLALTADDQVANFFLLGCRCHWDLCFSAVGAVGHARGLRAFDNGTGENHLEARAALRVRAETDCRREQQVLLEEKQVDQTDCTQAVV